MLYCLTCSSFSDWIAPAAPTEWPAIIIDSNQKPSFDHLCTGDVREHSQLDDAERIHPFPRRCRFIKPEELALAIGRLRDRKQSPRGGNGTRSITKMDDQIQLNYGTLVSEPPNASDYFGTTYVIFYRSRIVISVWVRTEGIWLQSKTLRHRIR